MRNYVKPKDFGVRQRRFLNLGMSLTDCHHFFGSPQLSQEHVGTGGCVPWGWFDNLERLILGFEHLPSRCKSHEVASIGTCISIEPVSISDSDSLATYLGDTSTYQSLYLIYSNIGYFPVTNPDTFAGSLTLSWMGPPILDQRRCESPHVMGSAAPKRGRPATWVPGFLALAEICYPLVMTNSLQWEDDP